jgi:nucleoside-diphosphate-sugar epimerase
MPKIVVAGASGLVGYAALKHFAAQPDWEVVGLSRRVPPEVEGAQLQSLDFDDERACAAALGEHHDATHLIYTAVYERPGLLTGWSGTDTEYVARNVRMLTNVLEPLAAAGGALEHVSVLQGTKAYGPHIGVAPRVPLRERQPLVEHHNFYFEQHDYVKAKAAECGWAWTVWRPELIVGEALGNNMSIVPPIAVYGALLRERGEPLHFPGNPDWWEIRGAIDTETLARALEWATSAPAARDEIFNIGNGDLFVWQEIWPILAEALGMEMGEERPILLAEEMPRRAAEWREIHRRYGLSGPSSLEDVVGQGWAFADYVFGHHRPPGWRTMITDSSKLRRHGFPELVDTELMFVKWFERLEAQGIVPRPEGATSPRLQRWAYGPGTGQSASAAASVRRPQLEPTGA